MSDDEQLIQDIKNRMDDAYAIDVNLERDVNMLIDRYRKTANHAKLTDMLFILMTCLAICLMFCVCIASAR